MRAPGLGPAKSWGSASSAAGTGAAPVLLMIGPMSVVMRVTHGTDKLDARAFRALLLAALGRTGEGIVVCDDHLEVLFSCPRATKLLDRFGGLSCTGLPETMTSLLREYRDAGEVSLSRRLTCTNGAPVHVRASGVWAAPPARFVLWLREETRRDEHLYAALNERYGLARRGFQLALLVRQGLTNREIARELHLSESTVKVYLHHLYRACRVSSRTALVALMDGLRQTE